MDLPTRSRLPLLLVHDGAEYDQLASLTTLLRRPRRRRRAAAAPRRAARPVHPRRVVLRVAAVPAHHRRRRPGPAGERYAVRGPVVVMGASLGGLTALLAACSPGRGSAAVYSPVGVVLPGAPRRLGRAARLPLLSADLAARAGVLDMRHAEHPLRIGMRAGQLEENAANNRDMAAALRRAGHDVTLREVPDLHNYTAWRDALDPASPSCAVWCASIAGCYAGCRPQGGVAWRPPASSCRCPATDRRLEVVRHGRWGRPVLLFPSEAGRAGTPSQRHARRGAAPRRRRPGQPVLRRLARRVVMVRQRASRPRSAPRRHAAYTAWLSEQSVLPWVTRPGRRRPGADHGRCVARRLPRGAPHPAARRRGAAGHRAVRQLRPGDVERVG